MTEPLSVIANITAVLAFNIQACRYLCDFFSQASDAPAEIRHYRICLQSLVATLCKIESICKAQTLHPILDFPSDFEMRLHSLKEDITGVQTFVNSVSEKMEKGQAVKAFARVKYAMMDVQKLKRTFAIIQHYQAAFILDLVAAQSSLTMQIPAHLGQLELQNRAMFEAQALLCKTVRDLKDPVKPAWSNSAASSFRARSWIEYDFGIVHWAVCRGDLKYMDTIHDPVASFPELRLYLQCKYKSRRKRITLYVSLEQIFRSSSSSLRFTLSHSRVVTRDAEIFQYARRGELRPIQSMFKSGRASPQDTSPFGVSVLHMAVYSNNPKLITYLVESGADINATDDDGRTPLHWATSQSNNPEISMTLVSLGADATSIDMEGKTPLHTFFNPTISYLLSHNDGIDESMIDNDGMTILQYIAWSSRSTVAHLAPFLEREPDLCVRGDKNGRTLLHFAAERGNVDLVKYICGLGFDVGVNRADSHGRLPIHYAARSKRVGVIDVLLLEGADIAARTKNGWTILHEAVSRNNDEGFKHARKLLGDRAEDMLNEPVQQGFRLMDVLNKKATSQSLPYLGTQNAQTLHVDQRGEGIQLRPHGDEVFKTRRQIEIYAIILRLFNIILFLLELGLRAFSIEQLFL